jgi:hypothetical protein
MMKESRYTQVLNSVLTKYFMTVLTVDLDWATSSMVQHLKSASAAQTSQELQQQLSSLEVIYTSFLLGKISLLSVTQNNKVNVLMTMLLILEDIRLSGLAKNLVKQLVIIGLIVMHMK